MGVQGEESWLGGSSQGRVAVGLASKGVITRVPHELLSAKLSAEALVSVWKSGERRERDNVLPCHLISFCDNNL